MILTYPKDLTSLDFRSCLPSLQSYWLYPFVQKTNPYGVDVCKLHFKTSKFEAEQKQLLKSVFHQEADLLCEETKVVEVITKSIKASHGQPLTFLEDLQDLVNNWLA